MFKVNYIIMNVKGLFTLAIVITIVTAGAATYMEFGLVPSRVANPSFSDLKAGAQITITSNDTKMLGGAEITSFAVNGYYAVEYNLNLDDNSILTGGWSSTGQSVVWVFINGAAYMETPQPDATHGVLNQTLIPGQYTLVVGGHPGDVISIIAPMEIHNYTPQQIGNFSIPAGTSINNVTTYSFYLNQPGELVGEITTPAGIYSFSMYSSSGSGFASGCSNSSAESTIISFSVSPHSQVFGPGYYNLTFSSGFYINQILEFVYYYDYSTN